MIQYSKGCEDMELKLLEYVNENLPQGFAPYTIYNIIVENQEVGRITLREGSDDERYFEGHIGYSIYDDYQGHSYAYQACLLLKEKIDKDHVIITCDPENIASLKTIEKLGCEYLETKSIPKHLKVLFTQEENVKKIYKWNLTS